MPSPVLSAREILQRQEFVRQNENLVFIVFEGVCPECYQNLELTAVGGIQEFIEDVSIAELDLEPTLWEPSLDGFGSIGFKQFTCTEGHVTEVYQTPHYDWNCSR